MEDQLKKLVEFHRSFGAFLEEQPAVMIPKEVIDLRVRLLHEELDEYEKAAGERDIVGVADALTDLLYVLLGTYVAHGLQGYAVALFDEVHKSNMSKLGGDGLPVTREDGKVLKSSLFRPPDLQAILFGRRMD